jgi:ribose/xylose/arabinose/galactoside ABC-type transport system permease subunit
MTATDVSPNAPPVAAGGVTETRQRAAWAVVLAKLAPLIGLAFVVALFSALRYETFFNVGNFELILRQTAVVGIAALGMTMIIIAGGIDLSVGSAIALVSVCVALFMPHYVEDPETRQRTIVSGVSPWLGMLGGLVVGTLTGVVNGVLVTRLRVVPFIITLGMMSILRGAAQGLAHNEGVYPVSGGFLDQLLQPVDPRRLWLLTPGVWLMLALAVVVSGVLRYTRFGRHVFAVGSNEQTARLCGVPVERVKLLVYTVGALLAAVAGVLQFSFVHMGDPTTAMGMELDIIAAVVIGGASLSGGHGTVLGTLVGALIMTVVANGCSKLGLQNWVQLMVTGGIIILAVALDRLRYRGAGEGQ